MRSQSKAKIQKETGIPHIFPKQTGINFTRISPVIQAKAQIGADDTGKYPVVWKPENKLGIKVNASFLARATPNRHIMG